MWLFLAHVSQMYATARECASPLQLLEMVSPKTIAPTTFTTELAEDFIA